MPQTLAQSVRAKYPGVYDDISDADLEAKVKAKYPGVYDDLPATQAHVPTGPGIVRNPIPNQMGRPETPEQAKRTLAMAANVAPALVTGGASLPVQMAAQGAGSTLGGFAKGKGTAGALTEGAIGAAVPAVTAGTAAVLNKFVARPLMGAGMRITADIGRKYGRDNIINTALENQIMPTAEGAAKAQGLRQAAQAEKQVLLGKAGERVALLPQTIAGQVAHNLAPKAQLAQEAGLTESADLPAVVGRFAQHPGVSPTKLDELKGVWDDAIGGAIQQQKFGGKPASLDVDALRGLSSEARTALESAAPGYTAANRRIMGFEGIRRAAANRGAIPATGLHDLATPLMMAVHPGAAIATRASGEPAVRGGLAIGTHELSKLMNSPAVRAAILALLAQQEGQ